MSADPSFESRLVSAAALGLVPRPVLAALLTVFAPERLSADDRKFLEGPLVVHQSSWNDTRPVWIMEQVSAERVGIVLGTTPQYIIGPTEMLAVMYGASLDAPLDRDYADLYLWAGANATARKWSRDIEAVWAMFGMAPIEDRDVLLPSGRLYHVYRPLAEDVRRRVIAQQGDRDRVERSDARAARQAAAPRAAAPATAAKTARPVVTVQISLFGEGK